MNYKVKIRLPSIVPLAIAKRQFAAAYASSMKQGVSHAEALEELQAMAKVPEGWRDARPFTGSFDPAKLRTAWGVSTSC